MLPSSLARCRYIQSSAPTGSAVGPDAAAATGAVPSLFVTAATPAASRIARTAAAAATGTSFFFCIGTPTSQLVWRAKRPHPSATIASRDGTSPRRRPIAGAEYTRYIGAPNSGGGGVTDDPSQESRDVRAAHPPPIRGRGDRGDSVAPRREIAARERSAGPVSAAERGSAG